MSLLSVVCGVQFLVTLAGASTDSAWEKLADGPWAAREGLMAVDTPSGIVMTGGRKILGAYAGNDVWRTSDGVTWEELPDAPFDGRAYHAMFYHNACVFVMGGQTVSFFGNPFYNDVWRSCDDGESWESLGTAPWPARAGIAFTIFNGNMIVAGGCHGSSIGDGRLFYNDVWSSPDGKNWTQLAANASWLARSGARLVVFQQKLLLVAGEIGFTPDTQLGDIWISNDGTDWTLHAESPAFSKRSGHGVVVVRDEVFVIAGWHDNKCLHDLYSSSDGVSWTMRSNTTWDCAADSCGKFDFWPVVVQDSAVLTLGGSNAYSTFGKLWADTWELSFSSIATV